MTNEETPLLERVRRYYSQLSSVAADLNAVSNELGKSITEIDAVLKKLNLGITTWVTIYSGDGNHDQDDYSYWSRDLGYAKVEGKWGISLRKVDGDSGIPDEATVEEWPFNDAPRSLRLEAIDKIPELLEKLSEEAVKATKNIRAKLGEAQAVAEVVKGAANGATRPSFHISINTNVPTKVPEPVASTPSIETVHKAIVSALKTAGHISAAKLLDSATWKLDNANLCIVVPGISKKMLALTVNMAAEKVIRQELQRLDVHPRFLVIPGEKIGQPSASISASSPLPKVSAGAKE
jgi:prefoldin subunit 5